MKKRLVIALFLINNYHHKLSAFYLSHYTTKEFNYLLIKGRINHNDFYKLKRAFNLLKNKNKKTIVQLYSQGGDYHEGLKIGRFIRNNNIGTYVDKYCASSCAYIFLAGNINGRPYRYIDRNAVLIFHKFAYLHPNKVSKKQLKNDRDNFLSYFSLNGVYLLGVKILSTPSPKYFFKLKSNVGHFVSSLELNNLNY